MKRLYATTVPWWALEVVNGLAGIVAVAFGVLVVMGVLVPEPGGRAVVSIGRHRSRRLRRGQQR